MMFYALLKMRQDRRISCSVPEHPQLLGWQGEANLGTLLAAGVLGVKDLIILAADKDMEHALRGLLKRPEALGIRPIEKDIIVHPEHDPACARRGIGFLSIFSKQYRHSLLM